MPKALNINKLAGEKIFARRNELGITQLQMAQKLAAALHQGYSQRQYQKLEEGVFNKYKKDVVVELDKLLSTNIYELVYEQNVPRGTLEEKPEVRPLYTIEELKKKIEEQWQVIKSQQETIHMIAKNAPPGINDASKNG